MTRLLIIGGSDAGISAALRAREIDPAVEVTLLLADAFPNYSICGLPYYLGGEVADWRDLAHRTAAEIAAAGITILPNTTATAIDPDARTAAVVTAEGEMERLPYDRLVIATGAAPVRPPIAGLDRAGVHLLHTMDDSFRVQRHLTEGRPRSAVIVGSGYIGLEMAEALAHRGLRVTLVGRAATPLPTVDASLGERLTAELHRHGVAVCNGVAVEAIHTAGPEGRHLAVTGAPDFRRDADLVLVAAGVRPVSGIAAAAGARTGIRGAIRVNRALETNLPAVSAAGDCVETWHRVLGRYDYLPLGTTAHKQGRVAGENAAGGRREFAGSLGTQVVKVFDLAVARTGLREAEAAEAGFDPLTVEARVPDHKAYYPGAHELLIRLTGDRGGGRLLGAQIAGHRRAEVAKRIDIFAAALFHGMRVAGLDDLDLSYTPPFSSPWDPVQMAAQAWSKAAGRTLGTEPAMTGDVDGGSSADR